jgi:hypothetical protein
VSDDIIYSHNNLFINKSNNDIITIYTSRKDNFNKKVDGVFHTLNSNKDKIVADVLTGWLKQNPIIFAILYNNGDVIAPLK